MKKWFILLFFLILLIFVYLNSGAIGKVNIGSPLFYYRLKRAIFAILIGGSLAVSGYFYQLVFSNSMADPFIIGVSQAAAIGAVVGIFYYKFPYPSYVIFSLFFSFFYIFIFFFLGRNLWKNSEKFLLLGISFNILFSSFLSFLIIFSSHRSELTFWLMGSLGKVDKFGNYFLFFFLLLSFIITFLFKDRLFSLHFSSDISSTSGYNPKTAKIVAFLIASVLSAQSVTFAGIIGFVGLIVPHISRYFCGAGIISNFFYSFFMGGILLLGADLVIRIFFSSNQIPVGVITGIVGALFFLKLLLSSNR